jgi:pimeloyl-ACP methyl ester carboxylesterase
MKILKAPSLPELPNRPLKATDIVPPVEIFETPAAEQILRANVLANANSAELAIVRNALQFSFIVYDPLDHLAQQLKHAEFTHVEKIQFRLTGTQAIACVKDKTAYIAFRGSSSPLDWIYDFLLIPFYWPVRHLGFGTAWFSVRGKVRKYLAALPADVKSVTLCGHSLGGGIAHMAALGLARDFPVNSVVTFGAPKACFLGTAKRYTEAKIKDADKTLGDITYSVVNQRDIVCKVPFAFLGYRTVGKLIYIDYTGAVHHGEAARDVRAKNSDMDIDFLFNFMEEEKIQALGPHSTSTEKFYYNMRRTVAWIGNNIPPLRSVILPSLAYILFSMYFMRSGLAHLGDKYMDVFMEPSPSWKYTPYQKTKFQIYFSLFVRFILGGVLLVGFLAGLVYIATWSVSGLMEQQGLT